MLLNAGNRSTNIALMSESKVKEKLKNGGLTFNMKNGIYLDWWIRKIKRSTGFSVTQSRIWIGSHNFLPRYYSHNLFY